MSMSSRLEKFGFLRWDAIDRKVNTLSAENDNLREQTANVSKLLRDHQEQTEKLVQAHRSLREEYDHEVDSRETLESENDFLRKDNDSLEKDNDSLQKDNAKIQKDKEKLSAKLAESQNEARGHDLPQRPCKNCRHAADRQKQLQAEIHNLRKQIDQAQKENERLQSGKDKDMENLRRENVNLQEEKDKLFASQVALQKDNDKLSTSLLALQKKKETKHSSDKFQGQCDNCDRLQAQIGLLDDKLRKFQDEIGGYKRVVSNVLYVANQVTDTTIQQNINSLFYAVRQWAMDMIRSGRINLGSMDVKFAAWLPSQIPGYSSESSQFKINALIVMVAHALIRTTEEGWIFGVPAQDGTGSIAAANTVYNSISQMTEVPPEKKKRWILLTDELLSKDKNAVERSREDYIDAIVAMVQQGLGEKDSNPKDPRNMASLRAAIAPYAHIILNLNHQEDEYHLGLVPATENGTACVFDPDSMEDQNGEEGGTVLASIFPMLVKKIASKDGRDVKNVVICKARVVLKS